MWSVARCLIVVVCGVLCVIRCALFVVGCSLYVAPRLLLVGCGIGVSWRLRCLLVVACLVLFVNWWWLLAFVACLCFCSV